MATKESTTPPLAVSVFPSDLGWMAVVTAGATVKQLTFGHLSAAAAKNALGRERPKRTVTGRQNVALIRRLQAYAAGTPDDFHDVPIDPGRLSKFQSRVVDQCRRTPLGWTVSYAELAARAGFPGAARAVGNCMAGNRIPLIVPCHRVVRSDGRLGSYSAPGGMRTKRRLLSLEARNWPRIE